MSSSPLNGRCGAKKRGSDPPDYCENDPRRGRTRCKYHGGDTPQGVDSPQFKTGEHSQAFKALGTKYLDALNDPLLLDMRRPIAIQHTVVEKCAERVAESDTPAFRKAARELLRQAMSAFRIDDPEAAMQRLGELGALLKKGSAEDRALKNLSTAAKLLATQQSDAWKIMLSAKTSFSGEELRSLLSAIMTGMIDNGIDEPTAWNVMGAADSAVFGNLLGFARADGKKWVGHVTPATGKGDSATSVDAEVVDSSRNGQAEDVEEDTR